MRILHVVTSVNPAMGGVAESIRSRGLKLTEMGHNVEVVSLDSANAPYVADYPLQLHALGEGYTSWKYHPALTSWLRSKRTSFDVVVVDGLWQFHGFATRRALRGASTPYFVMPHGMLDPWFKRAYPLKHLKKWLVWPWADYRVLRDAKGVLFTCEQERRDARESFALYRAMERVTPLGISNPPNNGVVLAQKFLAAHPTLAGKSIFLFLGRLHPKKGCDLLVDAFAKAAKGNDALHLVIAGPSDPGYLGKLQAQTERLGIGKQVLWLGMVRGDEKWGALYACDVFALISHQENFGIAPVEAMACGKPVLISDKVNIWREIASGDAGLVEPDTADGARRLLERWVNTSAAEKRTLGLNAQKCYNQYFSVGVAANAFLSAIEAV